MQSLAWVPQPFNGWTKRTRNRTNANEAVQWAMHCFEWVNAHRLVPKENQQPSFARKWYKRIISYLNSYQILNANATNYRRAYSVLRIDLLIIEPISISCCNLLLKGVLSYVSAAFSSRTMVALGYRRDFQQNQSVLLCDMHACIVMLRMNPKRTYFWDKAFRTQLWFDFSHFLFNIS